MELIKEIQFLLRKEFILEWRNKYAISGILLYVFSTVFIVYTAFFTVDNPLSWNALFWIVILFAAVNAVAKSFIQENSNRQLYYYGLANPIAIIISKVIYNTILLQGITLLTFFAFNFMGGSPVKDYGQFFLALFLGSLGLSIAFTFVSAIAAKANNSATLMAIMSFPVIIPILMTLIKLTINALGLETDTSIWIDIVTLIMIDAILLGVTFILFPFLWRD